MAFRAAEYERSKEPRSPRPVWWPLLTATLRRGWGSKWVRRLTFCSFVFGLAITGFLYFVYKVLPELQQLGGAAKNILSRGDENFEFDSHAYLILLRLYTYPFLLPLSLVFGYDLVAADLRSNAFESYFSRSITPLTYLAGRTLAYVAFLMLVTFVPLLWVWLFDVSAGPEGRFAAVSAVPLGIGASLLVSSTLLALLVQAVTSVTKSGLWTNLTFAAIFLLSSPVAAILKELTGSTNWFALSPLWCIRIFSAFCMGTTDRLTDEDPSVQAVITVMLSLAALSVFILWRTFRRRGVIG